MTRNGRQVLLDVLRSEGLRASLAVLLPLVAQGGDAGVGVALETARAQRAGTAERFAALAAERGGDVPMHPLAALHALLSALPAGGAVIDEAITTGLYVRMPFRSSAPGTYFFSRGGGLGWGLPAALGVKLARPEQPVLCVIGDGSIMCSIQALWTAAHQQLPVVVAVVDNRQYAILKTSLAGSGGRPPAAAPTWAWTSTTRPSISGSTRMSGESGL